jgi:hypothetical protein
LAMKRVPATIILTAISLLVAGPSFSCSPPAVVTPATFEVLSLKVSPAEAVENQEITVTAEVMNTGSMPGNFDEPLLVNGVKAGSKVVTMQPGTTKTLSYTISEGKPGPYSVALYNGNASFNVKAIVEREVEIKYDTGDSRTALWAGNNGGFLISLTPENTPFRLNKIRICGGAYGVGWEGKTFELYILDSDKKSVLYDQIYAISKFPVRGAFPYQPPTWVDFDVPPITIEGTFYVYLYTSTGEHKGIHVGVDDKVFNEHSELAQGKPPYVITITPGNLYPAGIWYADGTKDNWMIRAAGTALVPDR